MGHPVYLWECNGQSKAPLESKGGVLYGIIIASRAHNLCKSSKLNPVDCKSSSRFYLLVFLCKNCRANIYCKFTYDWQGQEFKTCLNYFFNKILYYYDQKTKSSYKTVQDDLASPMIVAFVTWTLSGQLSGHCSTRVMV